MAYAYMHSTQPQYSFPIPAQPDQYSSLQPIDRLAKTIAEAPSYIYDSTLAVLDNFLSGQTDLQSFLSIISELSYGRDIDVPRTFDAAVSNYWGSVISEHGDEWLIPPPDCIETPSSAQSYSLPTVQQTVSSHESPAVPMPMPMPTFGASSTQSDAHSSPYAPQTLGAHGGGLHRPPPLMPFVEQVRDIPERRVDPDYMPSPSPHRSPDGSTCKPTVKRPPTTWSVEEDARLLEAVGRFNGKNWKAIASMVGNKTPDQCSQRYLRVLRNDIRKGKWLPDEDEALRIVFSAAPRPNAWKQMSDDLQAHNVHRSDIQVRYRVLQLQRKGILPSKP